jgi:hypothetical protein
MEERVEGEGIRYIVQMMNGVTEEQLESNA